MKDILPLVIQLQKDAVDNKASVAGLLRIAKVIATKLSQKDALEWIDLELSGYMNAKSEDLPNYRKLQGTLKSFNSYRGWETVRFANAEMAKRYSYAPMGEAIGSMETALLGNEQRQLAFSLSAEQRTFLLEKIEYAEDVQLLLSNNQLWAIIDKVRNLILNWSLELERAGILGADMTFTEKEKEEAKEITQQFIIQNVGVIGNVGDQAVVTNNQTASAEIEIDKVKGFISEVQKLLEIMPKELRADIEPMINDLKAEVKNKQKDSSKIKVLLNSVKSVCEGAAGSLMAQGILSGIKSILG